MEWLMVLVGLVIGLIMASKVKKDKRERPQPIINPAPPRDIVHPLPPRWRERIVPDYPPAFPRQQLLLPPSNGAVSTENMLAVWRRSIPGLVKLAQRNLTYAKQRLDTGDYKTAVEAAVTSVENMSRALLHCYGEKPETNSGQEETLKLLSLRFKGNERIQFERAIEDIIRLHQNKIVHRYLVIHNISTFLHSRARATTIFDSASRINNVFERIIDEHFATEIPELREVCPKCRALDISVWSFNGNAVSYSCNLCHHRWAQPRTY
jgi:HEPN domain-containing protein